MDLDTFDRDPSLVAARLAPDEAFSLLARRAALPADAAALVTRDDGSRAVEPPAAVVQARGVRELTLVRVTPFLLTFEEPRLESSDGFECLARLALPVAAVAELLDLESFARTILGSSRRAGVNRLTLHLRDGVSRILHDFARRHPAEALLRSERDDEFAAVLRDGLKPLLFMAGLSAGRNVRLEVESPACEAAHRARRQTEDQRQRLEVERELRQAAVAAQQMHVEGLSVLLERLDELARQRPGVAVADLLRTFDARDRGALYRQLLTRQLSARRTAAIVVVAGGELLSFDPNDGSLQYRRVFDGPLGALRSVRLAASGGEPVFLIGAATGVYRHQPDSQSTTAYAFHPPRPPRGGVNSAALHDGALFATHSEVGVIRWPAGASTPGEVVLAEHTAGESSVRDVQTDDEGTLWFAAGARVIGWSPLGPAPAQSTQVPFAAPHPAAADTAAALDARAATRGAAGEPVRSASMSDARPQPATSGTLVSIGSIAGGGGAGRVETLCVAGGRVFVGTSDGRVMAWPCRSAGAMETLLSGESGRVESVQWMSGAGVERLLVAAQRPAVSLLVCGDVYRVDYRAEEAVRWAAAADDWIMGVNDRRDRIFLWRPWTPESMERTIYVGRMAGHSIQDALLAPRVE